MNRPVEQAENAKGILFRYAQFLLKRADIHEMCIRDRSREAVLQNTQGAIEAIERANPDFVLLQEVDIASTRSFFVNQAELAAQALPDYDRVFASNFHSAHLLYPFSEPHGSVEAGLLTLSRYAIEDSVCLLYTSRCV